MTVSANQEAMKAPEGPILGVRNRIREIAEVFALLLSPLLLFLVARLARPLTPFGKYADFLEAGFSAMPAELAFTYMLAIFPALAMSRWLKPSLALVNGMALIVALATWFYVVKERPVFEDIYRDCPPDRRPDPWIFVPMALLPLRSIAQWGIPLALAGLLSGPRLRASVFVPTYLLASFLISRLLWLDFSFSAAALIGASTFTLVGCLPIFLPGQRAAMLRLFGHPAPPLEAPAAPSSAFSAGYRFVSMIWVVGLIGSAGFGVGFNYIERQVGRVIGSGAPPVFRAPGLINGHEALKELFTKEKSEDLKGEDMTHLIPSSFSGVLPNLISREMFQLALAKARPEDLKAYLDLHASHFAAFEKARGADYLYYPDGDIPNFINFRSTARALGFRSMLRMSEGRNAEAVTDIDTVFQLGVIMQSDGTMVQYMIGVAIVGIATNAAYHYWLWNRDDPQSLALVEKVLDRHAPHIRRSFDFNSVRRTEPGWWPVVIYPPIVVPGFIRATDQKYLKWLEFDFVSAAVKLDLHRAKNGAYPDSLEALVPESMEKIPLDPSDGKPWIYENRGTEFELSSKFHEEIYKKQPAIQKLRVRFPASEVLNDPEARKDVEAWAPAAPEP